MALLELVNREIIKYVISQNVDGLHSRSGILPSKLLDLQGNNLLEKCMRCKRLLYRDYHVRTAEKNKEHRTGRKCDSARCGGELKDVLVNFGEHLHDATLEWAGHNAKDADILICMGSSMKVAPASCMAKYTKQAGGKVVIINL